MQVSSAPSPTRRHGRPECRAIEAVVCWAGAMRGTDLPSTWQMVADTDGAILLIPGCAPEPGFAIIRSDRGFAVLVCDPDDEDELGPFATLEAALAGISWWLHLPERLLDLPGNAAHAPDRSLR